MIRAMHACACATAIALVSALPARADKPVNLETRLAHSVMKGGKAQKNYLRVGLNGCERKPTERPPVNIAFVIDRSGSMQGTRIVQAREAAAAAVRRLDKQDIASVVIFDDKVDILMQAQNVDDPSAFIDRIRQVGARGSTAIHAGVVEGAQQVRANLDKKRLNRVVLLSDGQANVGPRNPSDFARLGATLLQEGISVSTIGLGLQYNEDLMLQLARASDGNHTFVGESTDLIQVFNKEFDDVLASCAQTVSIDVELRPGVRVVRGLSRDGKIESQTAQFQMNQIYAATEHYVLMEVEVDQSAAAGGAEDLGLVRVSYTSPDGARQTVESPVRASFSTSDADVAASRDNAVAEAVIEQNVRARTAAAITLRDQGRHGEAQNLFRQNVEEIQGQAAYAPLSDRLEYLKRQYDGIAATQPSAAASAVGGKQRKFLRQMDVNPAAPGSRY
jgi:Ca-activated chloride channel family protein